MKKRHLRLLLDVKELRDQVDRLTALVIELKEISMSGTDDLLREIGEEKAMVAQVQAALTSLVNVVGPLTTQLTAAQEALAASQAANTANLAALTAAQDALAAANASNAALDAQLAAANAAAAALDAQLADAAAGLNDGQTAIEAQLASLPGAPGPTPAPAPAPVPDTPPDLPADPAPVA